MKKELESKNGSENAIHFVDILMQHSELQTLTNADGATLRDNLWQKMYSGFYSRSSEMGMKKSL